MTNRKEWVHTSKRVRQPACVLLSKTTCILPPVSLTVFIIFLSIMMDLLSSQFNLVCKMPGIDIWRWLVRST